MLEVVVVNKHPFKHEDSFAGIKYTFEPNEKVTLPLAAAQHIFNVGIEKVQDRIAAMKRAGKYNLQDGVDFLKGFELTTVEYVPKDVADEVEAMRIDLEKQAEDTERKDKEIARLTENLSKAEEKVASLEKQLAEAQSARK